MFKFILTPSLVFMTATAIAGPLDPDCTAEKAAKSAVAKSTIGVGGRCSPEEVAKDSAKRAAGIEEEGMLEKRTDSDSRVDKVRKLND
jgi:hypothetical protein